jgi:hypothetical protein
LVPPGGIQNGRPEVAGRLTTAQLHIGLIEDTVIEAVSDLRGPIGFVAIDVDYYTASTHVLRIFDTPAKTRLPRPLVYADDIFGWHDLNILCSAVGEERAFADFNAAHDTMTIEPIRGLRHKRPVPAMWNEKMFALHDLTHPDYSTPINPASASQAADLLRLRN